MTVKDLIKELLNYEMDADIVFEEDKIVYNIDYVESRGGNRVSLKFDGSKLAL